MADLMLHLKVHLRNLFKEPLKMHKKVTERKHDVALDGVLEGAFVSAIEHVTDGSSEGCTRRYI